MTIWRTGPERCFCGCGNAFMLAYEGAGAPSSSDRLAYTCPASNQRVGIEGILAWNTFPNPDTPEVQVVRI